MNHLTNLIAAALLAVSGADAAPAPSVEHLQTDFRKLGFGMFIHYNMASGNWWDWGKKGRPFVDIAVTETRHFPEGNSHPGETCWQLEQKWFWEEGFKTTATAEALARHLKTAQSRNANFLLNVGPDKQGRIIESSVKTLAEMPAALSPTNP